MFVYLTVLSNCSKNSVKLFFLQAVFFSSLTYGQDTVTYCLRDSPWVSSCIRLCRPSPSATDGFFIRTLHSDDCQQWYGSGNFKQNKRKLFLDRGMLTRTLCHITRDSIVWDHFATDSAVSRPVTFKIKKNCLKLTHGFKKPTYFDLKQR